MAKVFPYTPTSSSSSSLERETFTIWMKSLVLNGNGCTVYNSSGEIVYRIDNYDTKCSSEVYLMDLQGNVLCTILKKKLRLFGHWDGYKQNGAEGKKEKPWFQVREKLLERDCSCQVIMGCVEGICYRIEGNTHKSEFKIIDSEQRILAEVKRKQSSTGVVLGDDVLSLMVEPNVDYSLIMALVAVYGLIGHKM